MLVGNKIDLLDPSEDKAGTVDPDKVVKTEAGKALAEELQIPFLETSAKRAKNVEEAFMLMAAQIKEKVATTPAMGHPSKVTDSAWWIGRKGSKAELLQQEPDISPVSGCRGPSSLVQDARFRQIAHAALESCEPGLVCNGRAEAPR